MTGYSIFSIPKTKRLGYTGNVKFVAAVFKTGDNGDNNEKTFKLAVGFHHGFYLLRSQCDCICGRSG
jgi:hypothetical protein